MLGGQVSVAQTDALAGTWELAIGGRDGGIAYVTFDGPSMTGYGITRAYFMPFTILGTRTGTLGAFVCDYSADLSGSTDSNYCEVIRVEEYINYVSPHPFAGTLTGVADADKLKATIDARGISPVKGTRPTTMPDLSGTWSGVVKCTTLWLTITTPPAGCPVTPLTPFKKSILASETWTITPTAGRPGSFDITGDGSVLSNSFVVTGTAIVNSHNRLTGFVQVDFGPIGLVFHNFSGKVNPQKGTLKIKGFDTHHGVLGKISGQLTRE